MSIELFLAFILASAVLAATPGPNVSLIIANGTSHGLRAGLLTVAGGISGVVLLVTGATLGMSSVMALVADWFDFLRWVGAAYLIWLGMSRSWKVWKQEPTIEPPVTSRRNWYWQGLAVSLSNPKILLFLGAFFPQFVNHSAPVTNQLWLLAIVFIVIVTVIDSSYAVLAGVARGWITQKRIRLADSITGALLICGGLWLAAARRA
ncbi:MAG: LysE family translocator [Alphaproteobacteria bacterium]